MNRSWDVIIIGGGPAGSTAARYASKENISVLVIDGKKDIEWVSGKGLVRKVIFRETEKVTRFAPKVFSAEDAKENRSARKMKPTPRVFTGKQQ